MKQGAIHVDWVISFGIFLISLITILIIFKPGVEEAYSGEGLVDILENKLLDDIYWSIQRIPLYIKKDCKNENQNQPEINVNLNTGGDWKFSRAVNSAGQDVNVGLFKFTLKPQNGRSIIPKENYFLYTYPYKKDPGKQDISLQFQPNDPQYCDVILGVTEKIEGISEEYINNLKQEVDLRAKWNYPKEKDFRIYLVKTDSPNYNLAGAELIYSTGEPFKQTSIYVKDRRDWLLSEKGERQAIILHLEVW